MQGDSWQLAHLTERIVFLSPTNCISIFAQCGDCHGVWQHTMPCSSCTGQNLRHLLGDPLAQDLADFLQCLIKEAIWTSQFNSLLMISLWVVMLWCNVEFRLVQPFPPAQRSQLYAFTDLCRQVFTCIFDYGGRAPDDAQHWHMILWDFDLYAQHAAEYSKQCKWCVFVQDKESLYLKFRSIFSSLIMACFSKWAPEEHPQGTN